jgi:hypothetical protein
LLTEHESYVVAFDKAARLLYGFWRAVGVVERYQIDQASIYPALFVQMLDVGDQRFARSGKRRGGPAEGKGRTDFYLV